MFMFVCLSVVSATSVQILRNSITEPVSRLFMVPPSVKMLDVHKVEQSAVLESTLGLNRAFDSY